jgi:hypothetical protein
VIKPWRWITTAEPTSVLSRGTWELRDGRNRSRATIWRNSEKQFTWHTWNEHGTGGENSGCSTLNDAKDQCVAAIVRQGWAPGGWEVSW